MTALEKPDLHIAFIPIVCAAPLLYAHRHGFFARNGLRVALRPAPGWSAVKELLVHGRIDAAHMLSPMPFACSLGIDGRRADVKLMAIQNVNGQAITLGSKHRNVEAVADMRGMTFGVPYLYSMQYYLLCDWLANSGVDPLKDVRIIEVAPPRMPYYLEKGRVDGLFAPEPYNQVVVDRGLGFILELSKAIWDGHPCCSFAVRSDFLRAHPTTCRALTKGLLEAQHALHTADIESKRAIAKEISDPEHLNQRDPAAVAAVLTGDFEDGRGVRRHDPSRVDFVPHAWPAYGVWILSQMQRWGHLRARVDYQAVADRVMQAEAVAALADEVGFDPETGRRGVERVPRALLDDPFRYMQSQPHCAFDERPMRSDLYRLSAPAAKRLSEITNTLADVAGGRLDVQLEVTSEDELGEVEHTLNEILTNLRFSSDALLEERDRLAETTGALREKLTLVEHQQQAIRELSMPIVEVWDGVLAVPIIGTLDSGRVAQITQTLLHAVVRAKARFAIIDLTGVGVLDTATADHVGRIVRAVELLGSRALVTGIQPPVAVTIVGLGVDFQVRAFRDLRDALRHCMREMRVDEPTNHGD